MKWVAGVLLVLLLFAAVTMWQAGRKEARSKANFPPEGDLISVDGRIVHAVVMGEGVDVVLIHGSGGNTRDYTFQYASKLAQNYRVIVMDRAGLGHSDPLPVDATSITDQARLLQRAAHQLGAEKPIVVGQSYGGSVALAWAVEFPDTLSGLVLLAAASQRWDGELDALYKITSHPILGPIARPLITAWVSDDYVNASIAEIFTPQTVPDGYEDYIGAGLSITRSAMKSTAYQRRDLKAELTALTPRYGEIAVPTELLHGTADTTVPIVTHTEPLSKQIPNAQVTLLDGVGHMPQHTSHDAISAAIARVTTRAGLR